MAHVRYQPGLDGWQERLRELMGSSSWREDSAPTPSVSITVIRSTRDGYWRVRQRGQPAQQPFAWYHEDVLLRELEWQLYAASAAESPAPLVVHAGAVAREGVALLLPGVSGAGKTTLTYALAARGWRTLTDDLLPLDAAPGDPDGEMLALPCARCGHVSPGTLDVLAEVGVALEGPIAGLVGYHRPYEWAEAAQVRYVVATQYQVDAACAVTPLTQAETAALLMKASFFQRHVNYHQQWQAAVRTAAQTRGWQLTYGRLSDAFDMIEQLTAANVGIGVTRVDGEE
ncbi:MAG TPA: hypothetical protein VH349_10045 [Ktedonobacterales bacterium]